MSPAPHAEPIDGDIFGREDNANRTYAVEFPGQRWQVWVLKGFTERVIFEEDLFAHDQSGGTGLVFLRRFPPKRRRRNLGFDGRAQRVDEIDDYGALGWGELPVPDEINGDLPLQDWPIVVLQHQRLLFNELGEGKRDGTKE